MKLDPKLAQSIVDKMMESIPYNINMMNEKGYIIASGDKHRINTLHIGAVDIIESGKTKPMIQSFGKFGQPGVNIPVEFHNEIIGVIGITGDPTKVTPLASLLKISTELLISQIYNTEMEGKKKETLNHFLYQWTSSDNIFNNEELKIRANALNIDLTLKRYAIIINLSSKNNLQIASGDFQFNKTAEQQLIITTQDNNVNNYLRYCQNNHLEIGISNKTSNLKRAVTQAQNTITLRDELNLKNIYYFKQVTFLNNILDGNIQSNKMLDIYKNLQKNNSNQELLVTLDYYFKNNCNVTDTSIEMNTHRNTINYRLNKISEIFDLDLHKINDLFELYVNYLYFKKYLYEHK